MMTCYRPPRTGEKVVVVGVRHDLGKVSWVEKRGVTICGPDGLVTTLVNPVELVYDPYSGVARKTLAEHQIGTVELVDDDAGCVMLSTGEILEYVVIEEKLVGSRRMLVGSKDGKPLPTFTNADASNPRRPRADDDWWN